MARKKRKQESAAQTLEQMESRADHIAALVVKNPMLVLGTA